MKHCEPTSKRKTVFIYLKEILYSYFPNKKDNLKQIFLKLLFLISLITLIISSCYLISYFATNKQQDRIIDNSRKIWHSETTSENTEKSPLSEENSDFAGWLYIPNTKIDNPIYQTDNNSYYLSHNQKKEKNIYGALFFDYKNVITKEKSDSNLIVYGHDMKNGSMFGTLKRYRSLDFYKQNPDFKFSTLYNSGTYKIYSIFLLNASKADDNNYIYNITRNSFSGKEDFNKWTEEAYQRSIFNTNVDTEYGDQIVTLVTCADDFKNARLIIMARKTRDDEQENTDTSKAVVNPSPRYPKKWYDDRGLKYNY